MGSENVNFQKMLMQVQILLASHSEHNFFFSRTAVTVVRRQEFLEVLSFRLHSLNNFKS